MYCNLKLEVYNSICNQSNKLFIRRSGRGRKKESMNKIKFTNLSGNMGNALIKDIYKIAYRLEATEVIVNKSKYGKNATCDLFCGIDCVAHDYVIAI